MPSISSRNRKRKKHFTNKTLWTHTLAHTHTQRIERFIIFSNSNERRSRKSAVGLDSAISTGRCYAVRRTRDATETDWPLQRCRPFRSGDRTKEPMQRMRPASVATLVRISCDGLPNVCVGRMSNSSAQRYSRCTSRWPVVRSSSTLPCCCCCCCCSGDGFRGPWRAALKPKGPLRRLGDGPRLPAVQP